MRVRLGTITVNDRTRRALNAELDQLGRATREDVRDYCWRLITDVLDGITSDYEERQRHRRERADAIRTKQRRRQATGERPQP